MVITWEQAAEWRRGIKGTLVFTNGVFDILHRGHIDYLIEARKLGDALIVGVNSDSSVKTLNKGPDRPYNKQDDRAFLLSQLKQVDAVVIFDQPTPRELIEAIQPDIVVKGGDYKPEDVVGKDTVERRGGRVVIVPLTEGMSTTGLVEKISKKE